MIWPIWPSCDETTPLRSIFTSEASLGIVIEPPPWLATAKPAAAAQTAAASSGAAPRPASLSTADRGGASAQPLQINISVSGALMTSEQVQDGIVRGLDHAHARGVIPRFLRNN